jgi:hypothetical protein
VAALRSKENSASAGWCVRFVREQHSSRGPGPSPLAGGFGREVGRPASALRRPDEGSARGRAVASRRRFHDRLLVVSSGRLVPGSRALLARVRVWTDAKSCVALPRPRLPLGSVVLIATWCSTLGSTIFTRASTTRGSNCRPALAASSASASSWGKALRYGRSVRMAFQESQQVMMRASRGIASAASPSG